MLKDGQKLDCSLKKNKEKCGSKGRTDDIVLDKRLHKDFERGEIDEYKIRTLDVGDIYVIRFHNDRGGWRLVSKQALLPHQEQPEIVRIERQLQIQERKKEYKWAGGEDKVPHFPGYIDAKEHSDIPKNSQFSNPSQKSFHTGRINAGINLGLSYLMTLTENWTSFDDYKNLYTSWVVKDKPKYAEDDIWMDDANFGMQYLNGTNPMMIERCNKLPETFPVSQALVGNCLDRGLTLEEEIEAGRIYIVDYSLLEGIQRYGHGTDKVRHVTEPLVLLYVNSKDDLVPIAIQLYQKHSDENPIWTPNDNKLDWLFVKMWAKAADLQIHQV
ncbi:hypothetical protein QZH41_004962 [Actinostola sp. cb2023]|nr:hypothetical protein QZH41_004962 [Actinostola sp. cb2023]